MEDRLEISNSKNKKIGLIIIGLIAMFCGLTNTLLGILHINNFYSYFFLIAGIGAIIGGLLALFFFKGPVVILTKESLTYNPKINGFVKWTDIEGFTDYSLNSHHTILIRLKNVDAFIENQKDEKLKKKMRLGLRLRETPIAIDPTLLEISRKELLETLQTYLVKYGQLNT